MILGTRPLLGAAVVLLLLHGHAVAAQRSRWVDPYLEHKQMGWPDLTFPTDRPLLWPAHQPSGWYHDNGLSIYGRSDGMLYFVPMDAHISRALAKGVYFLGAHGEPGRLVDVPNEVAFNLMAEHMPPGTKVIFNAVCSAGCDPGNGEGSLIEQEWARFRVPAAGPNGRLTFSKMMEVDGVKTIFYWVKDGATLEVLPKARAFTYFDGAPSLMADAGESLLNGAGEDVRFVYGKPTDAVEDPGGARKAAARLRGARRAPGHGQRGLYLLGIVTAMHAMHDRDLGKTATNLGKGIAYWEAGKWGAIGAAGLLGGRGAARFVARAVPVVGELLLATEILAAITIRASNWWFGMDMTWDDVWDAWAGKLDKPTFLAGPPPPADQGLYYN